MGSDKRVWIFDIRALPTARRLAVHRQLGTGSTDPLLAPSARHLTLRYFIISVFTSFVSIFYMRCDYNYNSLLGTRSRKIQEQIDNDDDESSIKNLQRIITK